MELRRSLCNTGQWETVLQMLGAIRIISSTHLHGELMHDLDLELIRYALGGFLGLLRLLNTISLRTGLVPPQIFEFSTMDVLAAINGHAPPECVC